MILLSFNITNNEKKFKNNFYIDDDKILEITVDNTEAILRILENHNILVSFFIEVSLAEKTQFLIKKIIAKGHEIAFYNEFSTLLEIESAKIKTEKFTGKLIRGFRQQDAQFSESAIKSLGFNYISNIDNANILFPFKRLERSTEIIEKNGISIIPESISPYSQIPYNDFVFQIAPLTYYKNMVFETIKKDDFVLIYLNSWQFTDFDKFGFKIPFYRKYNYGRKMEDKLESFLSWINENELATSRMKDFIF